TRDYFRKRLFRILPAYWVALTCYLYVFDISDAGKHGFGRVAVLYGLGQIYSRTTVLSGITAAWTLCIEISFYALLPLFAVAVRSASRRAANARVRLAYEVTA